MTVIDLRAKLHERDVDVIEVTDEYMYYAEELQVGDVDTVYLYSYDFTNETEYLISYFIFEDDVYLPHYYNCSDSIIALFENDGNKVWIIKIEKSSNNEVLRKKVPLIGKYFDCVPIDDNNIIMYSKADDEYREIFDRCFEETGCDVIANLYDLKMSYRYFIRDFKTAMLVKNNMHNFTDSKGVERMIICDPYCENEADKEKLSEQVGGVTEDIRDNIWEISKAKFLDGVRESRERIALKRIASAGAEGLVRFECIGGDRIIFRAKMFTTGQEQFFEMSTASGEVKPICSTRIRTDTARYFTDIDNGKIYYIERDGEFISLVGEINSSAEITYPYSIGQFIVCVDERFVIADSSSNYNEKLTSIYDGDLKICDTYQARVTINNNILILY